MNKYSIPSLLVVAMLLGASCVHNLLQMDPEKLNKEPSSSVTAPAMSSSGGQGLEHEQTPMELGPEVADYEEELKGAAAQRSAAPAAESPAAASTTASVGEKPKRHAYSEKSKPEAKRSKLNPQRGADSRLNR